MNCVNKCDFGTKCFVKAEHFVLRLIFVGAYSILMPNCSIGKNSIVAVGSIVTKRIPDGEVWGGIPAKFIMKTEDYARKMVEESKKFTWMPYSKKTSMTQEELIRHQQNFFFGNKA